MAILSLATCCRFVFSGDRKVYVANALLISNVDVGVSEWTQDACMVFGESAVTFLTLSAPSSARAGAFWESLEVS